MLNITPITNHREREKGIIVYPVYSRRSAGLSIGINLFTDKKFCQFDCPYCEVFPFSSKAKFSLEQLNDDLRRAILDAQEQDTEIKDICFSGNGEPTLSPAFPDALKLAEEIRAKNAPSAKLVVITNGAGLLQPQIFSLLKEYASLPTTDIWLKVDAGTQDWYNKITRSSVPFEKIIAVIKEFVLCSSVTIQTMLCTINGEQPPQAEKQAWEDFICELAKNTVKEADSAGGKMHGGVRKIQLYSKARPAPEDPLAESLPSDYLETRAAELRRIFSEKNISIPIEIYL